MIWLGVLCGVMAACGQSAAYLLSRRFIVERQRSPAQLLAISHTMLGLGGIVTLAATWDAPLLEPTSYIWFAIGAGGFYLLGQAGLFTALRMTDASRVSPLLGLKVVVVALLWGGLMAQPITPMQWVAVALAVAAAFVLNYTGGKLPPGALIAALLACLGFGLSDLHIVQLIAAMGDGPRSFPATMRAVALTYLFCGIVSAALLPWLGSRRRSDWAGALPYASVWYVVVVLLFSGLALAGPVLANIALATRGLWSIALGALIAAVGLEHLERRASLGVLIRRTIAAAMMVAAIALYRM